MGNSLAQAQKTSPKRTEEDSSAPPLHPLQRKPFLLLHICCGPCSTHVIDLLKDEYHPIGFFYNPNLHPKQEYFSRLEATAQVCRQHRAALWVPPFGEEAWLDGVKGLEGEPEGGRRCNICIRLRLEATAWVAKAASLTAFATTLTISPRKNSHVINALGVVSENVLYNDIKDTGKDVRIVGDADKVAGALEAVIDGSEMALSL